MLIKADLIPPEYLVYVEPKKKRLPIEEAEVVEKREKKKEGKKIRRKRYEDEYEEEYNEDYRDEDYDRYEKPEEESIFVRPKTPTEILRDVLTDFKLNRDFIERMVKRSERFGFIHPTDLRNYLLTLKSGIKPGNYQEANYIADEYFYALQMEERKSMQQANADRIYPVGGSETTPPPYSPPGYGRFGGRYSRYDYSIGELYRRVPPRFSNDVPATTTPAEDKLTKEDIAMMIREVLEDKKRDDEIAALKESMMEFQAQVAEAISSLTENKGKSEIDILREEMKENQRMNLELIKQVIESIKDLGKSDNALTLDKLETLLAKKEIEAERQRGELEKQLIQARNEAVVQELKHNFEILEKRLEEKGATEAMLEKLRKEFNEVLERQAEEYRKLLPSTSDRYQDDSMRLLADSVSRITDALEKKNPVGEIKDLIVKLAGAPSEREVPKELTEEVSGIAGNVADILREIGGEEYVSKE